MRTEQEDGNARTEEKTKKRPNPFDALFTARHRLMHPVAMDILQR
jgi:hypothetical protein